MAIEKSTTRLAEFGGAESATTTATSASEVHIAILPHGYAKWRGTRAQIEAEIRIPTDVSWPTGLYPTEWKDGRFHYALSRSKPDHDKSRGHRWLERAADLWCLTRTYLPHRHNGFAAARIYELRKALAEELWCGSASAIDQCARHRAAQNDRRFQSQLGRLLGIGDRPQR